MTKEEIGEKMLREFIVFFFVSLGTEIFSVVQLAKFLHGLSLVPAFFVLCILEVQEFVLWPMQFPCSSHREIFFSFARGPSRLLNRGRRELILFFSLCY